MLRTIRIKPEQVTMINHRLLMLGIIYIRSDKRTFNNTSNIYKHINQYSIDVFNSCKINKTHNVKRPIVILLMMLLLTSIIPLTLVIPTM